MFLVCYNRGTSLVLLKGGGKMSELEKFVTKWNTEHDMIVLLPRVIPGRMDRIELRFNPKSRPTKHKDRGWSDFVLGVDTRSRGFLRVTSNEVMYNYGVAEFRMASRIDTPELARLAIDGIRWVGESFLK